MANDAARSLKDGVLQSNEGEPQTIADGARTRSLGRRNWTIIQPSIEGIVEVQEKYIKRGVGELYAWGIASEPTGALTMGALLQESQKNEGWWSLLQRKRIGIVVSGGNVDSEVFEELISRN